MWSQIKLQIRECRRWRWSLHSRKFISVPIDLNLWGKVNLSSFPRSSVFDLSCHEHFFLKIMLFPRGFDIYNMSFFLHNSLELFICSFRNASRDDHSGQLSTCYSARVLQKAQKAIGQTGKWSVPWSFLCFIFPPTSSSFFYYLSKRVRKFLNRFVFILTFRFV